MKYTSDSYICDNCGDEWFYCPEDYEEGESPDICPFCTMPLTQMFREIRQEEGLVPAIKQVYKRYLKPMDRYWHD